MTPVPRPDLDRLVATDAVRAARVLQEVRAAVLAGRPASPGPRPVIGASWERMREHGVDPERDVRSGLLSVEDLQARRRASPLRDVLEVLRRGLLRIADATRHIMVVCDAEGRVLWREGSAPVLRRADGLGFELGADWAESVVGTNGVGTSLVVRRPVQVFSAEHFVRSHHPWTCAGAPITDPRDGRLLGVVDVSGPLDTLHPAVLALVDSVAQLAEARLRERHAVALEGLRAMAAPLLARVGGRAVVVDAQGWTAAVSGLAPVDRVVLPRSFGAGERLLPGLGPSTVEPLPGGWLIRVASREVEEVTGLVLDVSAARHWSVTVTGGAGVWTQELSPRHAELLYLLAVAPEGRTAGELAGEVFGDTGRAVTVRAELSRIRRYLGGVLAHRPYRFREGVVVRVVRPGRPGDLLPHSRAAAVRGGGSGGAPGSGCGSLGA
ncbi:GAF domain-containing protein [Streptomyces sp. NPDC058045]|uniref:GAF domain-containing protein n=1 Tax=Streptomyces sp. NPDC058045 TaxID=3346311 RepID=UPI0036E69C5F